MACLVSVLTRDVCCSYKEIVENFNVKYIAGGATQNSVRVAQVCNMALAPDRVRVRSLLALHCNRDPYSSVF